MNEKEPRPDPDCPICRGTGRKFYDTTHLGDSSGWNPGVAVVRCDCWPLDTAAKQMVAEIEEMLKEGQDAIDAAQAKRARKPKTD